MNPFLPLALCTVAATAATIEAQGLHVVPAAYANRDAPGTLVLPGISTARHMQIVIASSELAAIAGRVLTGIAFRRDHDDPIALASAQGAIVVRLGIAAHEPLDAVADFAANLPAASEVHRGPILAPAAPADPTSTQWASPNSIEITFANPFRYSGGPLCIEIECTTSAATWWPVDAIEDTLTGTVSSSGHACGPHAWLGETAWADASSLVIGRTAVFGLIGQPSTPCWMLVGLGTLPQPIDLGLLGLTGCELRVDAFTSLAMATSDPIHPPDVGGIANVRLHLANLPALLGAPLAVQWAEFGASFASSNTLSCGIAGSVPQVASTVIVSRSGESPTVQSAVTPVIGIRHD